MAAVSPESDTEHDTTPGPTELDAQPHGAQPVELDVNDEPSAEWGWHGTFPRATEIAGWITAASMFLMLIGNHENELEDWFLIGIGTFLVVLLVGGRLNRRGPWRR